jgi:hypothetical protein
MSILRLHRINTTPKRQHNVQKYFFFPKCASNHHCIFIQKAPPRTYSGRNLLNFELCDIASAFYEDVLREILLVYLVC